MPTEALDSVRRAHQRRCDAIALLLALDSGALTEVWRT